ncbi:MAG TPA: hypothetical protein V6C65_19200 [Allocoleopsis sp.]
MQVWAVSFFVFFGTAELYQWLQGITLPLPVLVVAGAILAIASNADKLPKRSQFSPPVEGNRASSESPQ